MVPIPYFQRDHPSARSRSSSSSAFSASPLFIRHVHSTPLPSFVRKTRKKLSVAKEVWNCVEPSGNPNPRFQSYLRSDASASLSTKAVKIDVPTIRIDKAAPFTRNEALHRPSVARIPDPLRTTTEPLARLLRIRTEVAKAFANRECDWAKGSVGRMEWQRRSEHLRDVRAESGQVGREGRVRGEESAVLRVDKV